MTRGDSKPSWRELKKMKSQSLERSRRSESEKNEVGQKLSKMEDDNIRITVQRIVDAQNDEIERNEIYRDCEKDDSQTKLIELLKDFDSKELKYVEAQLENDRMIDSIDSNMRQMENINRRVRPSAPSLNVIIFFAIICFH